MLVPRCICCGDVSPDKREILELVAVPPVTLLVKELFALQYQAGDITAVAVTQRAK